MKKSAITLVFAMALTFIFAQPAAFKYQTVVRDAGGVIIANQSVAFRMSIVQDSINGMAIYAEDHIVSTNDFGLVNMEIGNGAPVMGAFDAIDWGAGDHYLGISLDVTGGSNFVLIGASQLLSVPYSNHAKTAGSVTGNVATNVFPPVATVENATDIGSFSATLNGIVNAQGFSSTVVFEWGLTTSYDSTTTAIQSPVTGSDNVFVSADLTGLQYATTYHYRIKATNAVNITYSEDITFTTDILLPQLTTDTVTSIMALSAVSGGNITYDGGAAVTTRGVCWSTNPDPTVNDSFTEDGAGTGPFISDITGLIPATTYYVRAYATNSAGTGYGDQRTFTTQDGIISLTTANITNVTATGAVGGGNITNDGGASVIQRGVCWSTGSNPTLDDNYTLDGEGTGTYTSELSGLNGNTHYYVRAYATNAVGTVYGNEFMFFAFTCGTLLSDVDGNTYNSVLIGNQCWMKENLKTTSYSNAILIPNVIDSTAWLNLTSGAYVWYDNDTNWKDTYGALYNWYATVDPNGLCPIGWHVPGNNEWTALTTFIGGVSTPNGNELKSCRQVNSPLGGDCNTTEHPRWSEHSTHYGTDDFGFSALPGGFRSINGPFDNMENFGHWWSTTQHSSTNSWGRTLGFSYGYVAVGNYNKLNGFSVRCVRD
jgi:uncharacterized protein (TIGR02145 family)